MEDVNVDTNALSQALSPLNGLPDKAISLLRERLIQGGNETDEDKKRRGNALKWVETLRTEKPSNWIWERRPEDISENHWRDLRAGALFFEAREAALSTLDALEIYIGNQSSGNSFSFGPVPESLELEIKNLKSKANRFLEETHASEEANKFCTECVNTNPSDILRSLVKRDEQVLRLVGDEVKPGPAFRGSVNQANYEAGENEVAPQAGNIPLPEGISFRMRNLYLLNLDMRNELDTWLKTTANVEDA
jgi:hypothetical protein